ncbi:hypothetical protein [Pseudomonas sp. NMI1173_11]|uniref:hypothetical protein n=1 Tax=Pseudomonas sp. NMI1173_11 TaxID=2903145 RepID=UPI001E41AD7E|nr:hypothetical protein [Pseudomonas sp. NMI1173_11]MCE1004783.1 hypothetical protein [Pseudomonas sp. NMI1173_11]
MADLLRTILNSLAPLAHRFSATGLGLSLKSSSSSETGVRSILTYANSVGDWKLLSRKLNFRQKNHHSSETAHSI